MLTLNDLVKEAYRFLETNYDITLEIPIYIEECDEAHGGYAHDLEGTPCEIFISETAIIFGTNEVVYDILRHELIHYALHRLGKPFHDGDEYFESELKRLGVTSSGTNRIGPHMIYLCETCDEEVPVPPHLSEFAEQALIVSSCCSHKILFSGKMRVYNGEEEGIEC